MQYRNHFLVGIDLADRPFKLETRRPRVPLRRRGHPGVHRLGRPRALRARHGDGGDADPQGDAKHLMFHFLTSSRTIFCVAPPEVSPVSPGASSQDAGGVGNWHYRPILGERFRRFGVLLLNFNTKGPCHVVSLLQQIRSSEPADSPRGSPVTSGHTADLARGLTLARLATGRTEGFWTTWSERYRQFHPEKRLACLRVVNRDHRLQLRVAEPAKYWQLILRFARVTSKNTRRGFRGVVFEFQFLRRFLRRKAHLVQPVLGRLERLPKRRTALFPHAVFLFEAYPSITGSPGVGLENITPRRSADGCGIPDVGLRRRICRLIRG